MSKNELIYGFHAVKMVLQTRPRDVLQLIVQSGRQDQRITTLVNMAAESRVICDELPKNKIQELIGESHLHQGVVARCKTMTPWHENELLTYIEQSDTPVLLLVLDGVQDPHNLGACMRSANAFGVTAVIAPKDRAASLTDVARKVACGAAEQTPFVAVTNLNRTLTQLKKANVWLVGLDAQATDFISDVDLKGRSIAIVMGSEGEGLRRLTREACDYLAKIPMLGSVESLNVSVATGVALYEVIRRS